MIIGRMLIMIIITVAIVSGCMKCFACLQQKLNINGGNVIFTGLHNKSL